MNDNGINVLSLFDGMSCGQIALERAGIKVNNYFASEIDKYAIKVAQKNYPNTIQLGDVTSVKYSGNHKIDLLIGGSPCQGFSFAGKQLNFDDPRSKLFFEFVRLMEETKPKYFLLENVRMKKESQDIISKYLGVEPITINSSLLSAQNRVRFYWTNIPNISQPKDIGLFLKDIVVEFDETKDYFSLAKRGRYDKINGGTRQVLESRFDGKANALTTVEKDSMCLVVGKTIGINGHDILKRVYSIDKKSPTLTANSGGNQQAKIAIDDFYYRRLLPIEYERLQTVPDNYTDIVSNSQRYRMIGNGWTVDVIAHIFKNII